MSKKKVIVVSYAGQRISLDAIAGYCPIHKSTNRGPNEYGVRFNLRTGEAIEMLGDDIVSRDKVITFLDSYFSPAIFTSNKCQVCAIYKKSALSNNCSQSCHDWDGYQMFKRKEDANLSSDTSG